MAWEDLLTIFQSAHEERVRLEQGPPVDCPNDGTTLQQGPDGQLFCPFDGWVWCGEPVTW